MTKKENKPPRPARYLLTRVLRDDIIEEVLGDLQQRFDARLKSKSIFHAQLSYWYEAIHYLRPFALRRSKSQHINHHGMFRNYVKIGWRNLLRQKMYSAIKIGGFAIGIAACFLIGLYIQDEMSYDRHIPENNRIFRVINRYNDHGEIQKWVWFQAPFAQALKEDYPDIELAGRYNAVELFGAGSHQIRSTDKTDNNYEDGFVYFDQELLDILRIPFVYGNPAHALDQPKTIVLTRRKAQKYFPNEDPVGKTVILDDNPEGIFKVGGVIEDFPATSHLQFDFLMTLKGINFYEGEQSNWNATNYHTYVKLREGISSAEMEEKLRAVVDKYLLPMWIRNGDVQAAEMSKDLSFVLQPVTDIHLRSGGIEDSTIRGDIRFVWLFGGVAFFILLIAVVNFVNLSTAKSANRAKEVGLRKAVGSVRSHIINQFLTESVLYSLLSFVLGLFLASYALPWFNMLASKSILFPWTNIAWLALVIPAAVLVGVLAGLYPSFYLSAFTPAAVLKGNLSRGSGSSSLRSTLVVFQFTTSIILIICTVIIYRQVDFILNRNVGFDKDQVIILQGVGTMDKQLNSFRDELLQLPGVRNVSLSDYLPIKGTKRNGNPFWNEGTKTTEKSVGGQFWRVDPGYLGTLGIQLKQGRDFDRNMASDTASIIINESMARELGLKDPIGKVIENQMAWNVIGVVEDFNFESLKFKVSPLAMVLGRRNANIASIKVNANQMSQALESIQDLWKKFSPHQPIRYSFLDESFARMYDDVKRMERIFSAFAILAILVACLGLFALSAFMVEQRTKEISIRLVMGASMPGIYGLLTRNFLKLVLIAFIVAAPIAWYAMNQWLKDFEYKTEITWDVFVLAGISAAFIALLTISYQATRAALLKPAAALKAD